MAFLGIPFALQKGRGASLTAGIAISVLIGFSFYIVQAMLLAFGYSGVFPPLVAAWAANLLFFLLGLWLVLSVHE
jgi:lipopolysaccharide export system permease protein